MTGLLLIAAAVIWLAICVWLIRAIGKFMPKKWWSAVVKLSVIALLLLLPLIDEIVGARQFAELCKRHDAVQVDRERANGKTVYLLDQPDRWIEKLAIPVRSQKWTYVDVATRETVVEWHELYAAGGYLVRLLKISEGNVPLTFKGSCAPESGVDSIQLFKKLGVVQVQQSTIDKAEKK